MTPYNETNNGDWNEWRRLVLNEMKRTSCAVENLEKEVTEVKERVSLNYQEFKIRSGVWGVVGGAVTVLSVLLLTFVKRLF